MKYTTKRAPVKHELRISKKDLIEAIELQLIAARLRDNRLGDVPKLPANANLDWHVEAVVDEDGDEDEDIEEVRGIVVTWQTDTGVTPGKKKR